MGITATTGLISGINFTDLISQLIELERRPVTLLEEQRTSVQTLSAEFSNLSVRLSALRSQAASAAEIASFNPNAVTVSKSSTGLELLSASVSSEASPGLHQVRINQLAAAHSLASDGFVDENTTGVAAASGTFTFSVGSGGKTTSVSVDANTTLAQLRDAINTAGGDATASLINDGSGSNPYRLVLTAKKTGVTRTITVSSNPTTLDFTNKKVEAAFASASNSFTGTVTSNEGSNYTGTTNKAFLVKIVDAGDAGVATYKYSIDGGITFLGANGAAFDGTNAVTTQGALTTYIDGNATSNSTNEGVQVAFGAGTLAADDTFTVDVFAPTLQAAQDAVVEVGNLTFTKDSNTVTEVIQGVTLNLLKAAANETIDVQITTDTSQIKTTINEFLDVYNATILFLDDQLSFDPDVSDPKPLQGESLAVITNNRLKNLITGIVPGANATFNSLSTIGITSNKTTGALSLDEGKLDEVLEQDLSHVTRLLAAIGTTNNASLEFVSKTTDSRPGTYAVTVTTAPAKAAVTGSTAVPSGGITQGETLSISLFTNATDPGDTPLAVGVTLAAGSKASDIVNALNSAFATSGMALSASRTTDNKIQLTASNFGDDYKIIAFSSVGGADQSGLGTTPLSSQGIDVEGTINGHAASGAADVLTGNPGFAERGIKVRTAVATTGLLGSVTLSSGVADRMHAFLDNATGSDGTIDSKLDGLAQEVARVDREIERKEGALLRRELALSEQFARLETLLNDLATQSQVVTDALASLSNLATAISRR